MEEPVITRSARRRKVALTIRPEDGRLEVLAPLRLARREIDRILELNAAAVARLRRKFDEFTARRPRFEFREGGEFRLLDRRYPVRFTRKVTAFDNAFLIPAGDEAAVKRSLENLYRKLARDIITQKLTPLATRFDLPVKQLRIGGARGRWGSCSRGGSLNFSWRLIQCPEPAVEYVIIHELAHLVELNHSERFWKQVERMCPEYRQWDRFLRKYALEYSTW